jgi:hypothetical protein
MAKVWHEYCRVVVGGLTLAAARPAAAQEANPWRVRLALYGFLPDLHGESRFSGADEVDVKFKDLLKKTDVAFMGVADVHYNRVGAFVDVVYFDLGHKVDDTTKLKIGGGIPLPPGITADLSMDVKSWIVTTAAEYRVYSSDAAALDLFAGARMSETKPKLKYAFSQEFGPFVGPLREGTLKSKAKNWDGIVGAKGRVNFGKRNEWFLLGYVDAGTGDSDLTWQFIAAGGRRFGKVDTIIGWRRLSYDFKSNSPVTKLVYSGPVLGVSVTF